MEYKFNDLVINLDERSLVEQGCFVHGELYEKFLYEKVYSILQSFSDKDTFLDVGSHIGFYSLLLQKGKSYAFEPTIKTFEILKENVKLNPNKDITIFNKAVANSVKYYYVKLNSETSSGTNQVVYPENEATEFKSVFLDGLEFEGDIRLIKIDTEGNDDQVISGAINLIKKHKPIIIIENLDAPRRKILEYIGYNHFEGMGHNNICEVKNE